MFKRSLFALFLLPFLVGACTAPATISKSSNKPSDSNLASPEPSKFTSGQVVSSIKIDENLLKDLPSNKGNSWIPEPYGDLAFGGDCLWVVYRETQSLLKIDLRTGKADEVNLDSSKGYVGLEGRGLTHDGTNLWISEGYLGDQTSAAAIYRVNPATGIQEKAFVYSTDIGFGFRGEPIIVNTDKISRENSPYGLAWDGQALWCSTFSDIHKLDPSTGAIILTLTAPISNGGLAYGEGALWGFNLQSQETDSQELLKINPETGTVEKRLPTPAKQCMGLEFDGSCLWTYSKETKTLYRIKP